MKLDKQPDPRIIYKYNELDLGRINGPVLVQRVSQNPTVMHGHRDFVEMVFVTGGSCLHEISTGESYVIGTGDVFFVPEGTTHSYSQMDSMTLVNILVRSHFMESALARVEKIDGYKAFIGGEGEFRRVPPLAKDKLNELLDIAGRIEAESWEGGAGRDEMLQALLIELLIRLFRYARASENISMRAWPDFGKLAEYLDSHIQRKASVAAMARSGGVSKRTLLRKFKEQTGLSPMECLNQMRLSKACRLLRESPMEIKHIAIACGFPDSNYFSRQFRKSLGITPRRFRNAHVIGGA